MKCPICGSEKHERFFRLCDNMRILGKSFSDKESYVAACDDCGMVFTDTIATQEDFLSYYKHGAVSPKYYEMFGEKETNHYYEHILSIISPFMTKDSRIYDVAGAWGELDKFLFDKGFVDITVIDPNADCIKVAESKGLKVAECSTADMKEHLQEKCDVLILNHTLEHILDVKDAFDNMGDLLKEEGYIFIEIPDALSYVDEAAAPFNFLTYEHVLHLTMHDLENLAALYGYEICVKGTYYKKVSNYPSVYAVFKKNGCRGVATYSNLAKKKVKQYIDKSRQSIEAFIEPLRDSGEPLILWGIGASTAILLDSFAGCNVTALIDRNPMRQGLEFRIGASVLAVQNPDTVGEGTIVILSIPYHASIAKQIRDSGLKNKIVSLA